MNPIRRWIDKQTEKVWVAWLTRSLSTKKKLNSTYVRIFDDKNPLCVTPVVMKRNNRFSHTTDIYIERAAIFLPAKLRSTLEKLALLLSGTTLKVINKEHNLITQTGKADNAHLSTRVSEPTRSSPSSRSCLKVIAIPTRREKHPYPKKGNWSSTTLLFSMTAVVRVTKTCNLYYPNTV